MIYPQNGLVRIHFFSWWHQMHHNWEIVTVNNEVLTCVWYVQSGIKWTYWIWYIFQGKGFSEKYGVFIYHLFASGCFLVLDESLVRLLGLMNFKDKINKIGTLWYQNLGLWQMRIILMLSNPYFTQGSPPSTVQPINNKIHQ